MLFIRHFVADGGPCVGAFRRRCEMVAGTGGGRAALQPLPELSAFVENEVVKQALTDKGEGALPLLLVNGQVLASGQYPARDQLAAALGVMSGGRSLFSPAVAELVALGARWRQLRALPQASRFTQHAPLYPMSHHAATATAIPAAAPKRLNFFERYLSLWVLLCMMVGVALGKLLPDFIAALSKLEFGNGSQVNIPIAVLIWLMIYR